VWKFVVPIVEGGVPGESGANYPLEKKNPQAGKRWELRKEPNLLMSPQHR